MSDALSEKLGHYLAPKFDVDHVAITDLARIPGGASRETYRFRAAYTKDGTPITRADIAARSTRQPDRHRPHHRISCLSCVLCARPSGARTIALELSEAVLERPFFIMEEIPIVRSDPFWCLILMVLCANPLANNCSIAWAASPLPTDKIGPGDLEGARENCWRFEVDRWEREIIEDEREPQVIAHAAIRWLKRTAATAAKSRCMAIIAAVIFFMTAKATFARFWIKWRILAIRWRIWRALDPLWAHGNPAFPAGTIARDEAIARWQAASGLTVDAAAFAWWEMFASLKGLAIWISAAREYCDGRNTDPVNAFSGWYCQVFHNRLLAERLSALES